MAFNRPRLSLEDFQILGQLLMRYAPFLNVKPNATERRFELLSGRDRFEVEIASCGFIQAGAVGYHAYKEAAERARGTDRIPVGVVWSGPEREAFVFAPISLLREVER